MNKLNQETDIYNFICGIFSDYDFELQSSNSEIDKESLTKYIKTYTEEAVFGFNRINRFLDFENKDEFKILEVGAGSFLLTAYLSLLGFNVTALEPISSGFECFNLMQNIVLEYCKTNNIVFNITNSKAEEFISSEKYDFIFSINVLEHIEKPFDALDKMKNSLAKNGRIFIYCPNYLFPYEPHFRIFLPPFGKKINEIIFKNIITKKQEIWNDLNFINFNQIVKYVKHNKLFIKFNNNIIYDLFKRIETDKEFQGRMPKIVYIISKLSKNTGMINLIKFLPPNFQSPMEFVLFNSVE